MSLNQILNITSGTTSSEAEKKYVYTINSDAASMYFSYDNTNRKKRYLEYQRLKFGSHLTIKAIYKQYKKFLPCHLSVKGENIAKQNTLLWPQTITAIKCSYPSHQSQFRLLTD